MKQITVIGASLSDITGIPNEDLILNDSNPGKILISDGGVARNISENLARLKVKTNLITAFGNDMYSERLQENCRLAGINTKHSLFSKVHPNAACISVNDAYGNLEVAVANTSVISELTSDFLKSKADVIENSEIVILDTNIEEEVIHEFADAFGHKKLFVDMVSSSKANKVKRIIGKFHTIKPNLLEAEMLTGIRMRSEKSLLDMKDFFIDKGVKQVFITLGKKGSFYADEETYGFVESWPITPINVSGAGDAFVAGLTYSHLKGKNIEESARFATAMSVSSLLSQTAVNPDLSMDFLKLYLT